MKSVDIVIPTRNRGPLIDIVIESIRESNHKQFTLWVVDQSDDDSTQKIVERYTAVDSRIRYLRSKTRGANFARNEGVAASTAELIAFTDDDCRADREWLGCLVDELSQPEVRAVFGRVLPDEGMPSVPSTNEAPVSSSIPMALKDTEERSVYQHNRFDLSFGHGANMGWQRSALLSMGGFDGNIGAGGPLGTWDERDAGYRILSQKNGCIVYTPNAVVHHRHWRGWNEVYKAYKGYAIGTGASTIKYLRCGDLGGLYLFAEWLIDQGVRQILSGILKWRSWQKIQIGWLQIIYPWIGAFQGLRYPINRKHMLYESEANCLVDFNTHEESRA